MPRRKGVRDDNAEQIQVGEAGAKGRGVFAATYNDPKRFVYNDVGPTKAPENVTRWEFSWGVQILNILPLEP